MAAPDQRIWLIIDGSGSMRNQRNDVKKGIDELIDEQKDESQSTGDVIEFSLTVFDTNVAPVYVKEEISLVNPVPLKDVNLGGGTALLDAVGKTLGDAEDDTVDRNLVVIYTDGYENASREFTFDQIKDLIDKLEATGKFQFMFLGAELADWSKEASKLLTNSAGKVAGVSKTSRGVAQTFANVSTASTIYRTAPTDEVERYSRDGLIASLEGLEWEDKEDDVTTFQPTKVVEPK